MQQNTEEKSKCIRCKVNLPLSEFSIKRSGELSKQCKCCLVKAKGYRDKAKCEHNKQRNYCKICKGSAFCSHDKRRAQCVECGGASICEHQRIKNQCKDCGGISICEHNRLRSTCKDCKGAMICQHNKVRSQCVECDGASMCEHKRLRCTCKHCDVLGYLRSKITSRMYAVLDTEDVDISHLGCSLEEYKIYLESKFKENMGWNNAGEWHVDHIKPIGHKDVPREERIRRLHYLNTQPLWALENAKKGIKEE